MPATLCLEAPESASRLLFPLFALALAALAGCSDPKQGAAGPGGPGGGMPALPVTVLEAQPTRVPISVEVMAQTEGAKETEVRARVGGILVKRLYQEGEPVKEGQPLFQIDRAPYEIALAQAKAALAGAKAQAEQAGREAARLKGLLEKQAISRKEYDDATSSDAISHAAVLAAEATLRQAELNLAWTTVAAPVAGQSGRALKSEGNLVVQGSDNLLTAIHQSNPLWVRFSLAESDTAKLPGGRLNPKTVSGVELVLADGSVYPRKGHLNFQSSQIDPTLGTQQFRAEFDNAEGRLLPGQFVRVRLLTGMRDGVFLVPQSAVLQTEQGRLVMVAGADNKVAPRPVQAGEWLGKDWVILGGLQAGDKVIVDNLMKLRPGAPVMPHKPGEMPPGMGGPGAGGPGKPAAKG
ncbi:MAG TPA: efflux RND transporter periplasmic adaptor subunit [Thiobacillaceae bacterium]|nr:efflux RND transporter periplasmic adaptor subunit [Thiobacillaceae bacterium]